MSVYHPMWRTLLKWRYPASGLHEIAQICAKIKKVTQIRVSRHDCRHLGMEHPTGTTQTETTTHVTLQCSRRQGIASRLQQVKGNRSIRSFSKPLGVNPETMRRYLASGQVPAIVIAKVSEQYDLDCNWLLTGQYRDPIPPLRPTDSVHLRPAVLSRDLVQLPEYRYAGRAPVPDTSSSSAQ